MNIIGKDDQPYLDVIKILNTNFDTWDVIEAFSKFLSYNKNSPGLILACKLALIGQEASSFDNKGDDDYFMSELITVCKVLTNRNLLYDSDLENWCVYLSALDQSISIDDFTISERPPYIDDFEPEVIDVIKELEATIYG